MNFWGYISKGGPNECWPWRAGTNHKGYGYTRVGKKVVGAHRVAYELTHGPIPDGLLVRHTCDNPPCCNPAHLILGTHKDNTRDMMERERGRKPGRPKKDPINQSQFGPITPGTRAGKCDKMA